MLVERQRKLGDSRGIAVESCGIADENRGIAVESCGIAVESRGIAERS